MYETKYSGIPAIAKGVLEEAGYSVVMRTSSQAAFETFREAPDAFDLVLTDQTMPHMTGDILAETITEICPDIPIILCTGFSSKISPESALAKGIKVYLQKPFTIHELKKAVRMALAKDEELVS